MFSLPLELHALLTRISLEMLVSLLHQTRVLCQWVEPAWEFHLGCVTVVVELILVRLLFLLVPDFELRSSRHGVESTVPAPLPLIEWSP